MAQLVARILGKDEVGGSSPLGSLEGIQLDAFFFYLFLWFVWKRVTRCGILINNYKYFYGRRR